MDFKSNTHTYVCVFMYVYIHIHKWINLKQRNKDRTKSIKKVNKETGRNCTNDTSEPTLGDTLIVVRYT